MIVPFVLFGILNGIFLPLGLFLLCKILDLSFCSLVFSSGSLSFFFDLLSFSKSSLNVLSKKIIKFNNVLCKKK